MQMNMLIQSRYFENFSGTLLVTRFAMRQRLERDKISYRMHVFSILTLSYKLLLCFC